MTALEPCDSRCLGCGRVYCRDEEPSPGEEIGVCPACWEQGEGAVA